MTDNRQFLDQLAESTIQLHALLSDRDRVGLNSWSTELFSVAKTLRYQLGLVTGEEAERGRVVDTEFAEVGEEMPKKKAPDNSSRFKQIAGYLQLNGPRSVKAIARDNEIGLSTVSGWMRRRTDVFRSLGEGLWEFKKGRSPKAKKRRR